MISCVHPSTHDVRRDRGFSLRRTQVHVRGHSAGTTQEWTGKLHHRRAVLLSRYRPPSPDGVSLDWYWHCAFVSQEGVLTNRVNGLVTAVQFFLLLPLVRHASPTRALKLLRSYR